MNEILAALAVTIAKKEQEINRLSGEFTAERAKNVQLEERVAELERDAKPRRRRASTAEEK